MILLEDLNLTIVTRLWIRVAIKILYEDNRFHYKLKYFKIMTIKKSFFLKLAFFYNIQILLFSIYSINTWTPHSIISNPSNLSMMLRMMLRWYYFILLARVVERLRLRSLWVQLLLMREWDGWWDVILLFWSFKEWATRCCTCSSDNNATRRRRSRRSGIESISLYLACLNRFRDESSWFLNNNPRWSCNYRGRWSFVDWCGWRRSGGRLYDLLSWNLCRRRRYTCTTSWELLCRRLCKIYCAWVIWIVVGHLLHKRSWITGLKKIRGRSSVFILSYLWNNTADCS